jgi:hypothetical protein
VHSNCASETTDSGCGRRSSSTSPKIDSYRSSVILCATANPASSGGKERRIIFRIARTAYNTSRFSGCPYLFKGIHYRCLHACGHPCYPMEPVLNLQFCIHWRPVQEMCPMCVTHQARFLVIAAPRPSGSPDLDQSRQDLPGGAFLPASSPGYHSHCPGFIPRHVSQSVLRATMGLMCDARRAGI